MLIPSRAWRKKTGPGEPRLIRKAMNANSGAATSSATRRETMSIDALDPPRRAGDARPDGSPTSGSPSIVWTPAFGPTSSNRRGTMSIWTRASRSSRTSDSVSSCDSPEKATIDAVDVELATIAGELVGVAQHRQVAEVARGAPSGCVDKADEVEAVLGVLQDLPGDSWPISPAPTISVFCW